MTCATQSKKKVTTDILSNALKEGVGIWNVEIGPLLRRQPWASSASDNADVLNVNRQLKSKAEKGMESIFGHIVVIGRT